MNKQVAKLYAIAAKETRLIIGLMSGTSLDGLDIALCKCSGTGSQSIIELLEFKTIPYCTEFKEEVKSVFKVIYPYLYLNIKCITRNPYLLLVAADSSDLMF
jgi:anhydro-N-acetylmuramic acid kinase